MSEQVTASPKQVSSTRLGRINTPGKWVAAAGACGVLAATGGLGANAVRNSLQPIPVPPAIQHHYGEPPFYTQQASGAQVAEQVGGLIALEVGAAGLLIGAAGARKARREQGLRTAGKGLR